MWLEQQSWRTWYHKMPVIGRLCSGCSMLLYRQLPLVGMAMSWDGRAANSAAAMTPMAASCGDTFAEKRSLACLKSIDSQTDSQSIAVQTVTGRQKQNLIFVLH